ncbi:hypothetical protein VSS74_25095 [Conexibacter stalactiti]|uniref:Uncharacterized protein n=1 Tax=Conexibacter stalactiti TaxID=1940611 RepID=A0ABU4HY80_9ACTN|nr:hypothetical protein [Conexibacter stalactiti]MDW5597652.1 hypothetical protein [Conexibacter stalactiti]MEC5038294.1 hypothetical protein [Conexibacter stalactiti]
MENGDLILTLEFDDSRPPEMGSCGAELYAALAPLAYDDAANGWPLAHLCEALGRMRQPVSDMVRAWEETVRPNPLDPDYAQVVTRSGWTRATHVDAAPGAAAAIGGGFDMLPFLGQLVGVRGIEGLNDSDRRAAIRERAGFSRGRPRSIVSFAERFTDGTPGTVRLRERYNPAVGAGVDAPYHGRVLIRRSRLSALERDNLALNPRVTGPPGGTLILSHRLTGAYFSAVACPWHAGASMCHRVVGIAETPLTGVARVGLQPAQTVVSIVPGELYTASSYVTVISSAEPDETIGWTVSWRNAGGTEIATETGPTRTAGGLLDARLAGTFRAPANATRAYFQLWHTSSSPGQDIAFEMTATMIEQGARPGTYGDGDSPGWRWLGAPGASLSEKPGMTLTELTERIRAIIPAGLVYDLVITDDLDYDDVEETHDSYTDLITATANYSDLLEA